MKLPYAFVVTVIVYTFTLNALGYNEKFIMSSIFTLTTFAPGIVCEVSQTREKYDWFE